MGTLSKISLSGVVFRISITSLLVQPKKTISAETLSQRQLGKTPLCTEGGDGGEDVDHRSPGFF